MKRRKWTSEAKAEVVLSGLKGSAVAAICKNHDISRSQYDLWQDQFLSQAGKRFDTQKVS